MKKAILLCVKPEWLVKILNGEKTVEIRKAIPNCDLPIDVYLYCCKGKELIRMKHGYEIITKQNIQSLNANDLGDTHGIRNGKIVGKFTLNKTEKVWWGAETASESELKDKHNRHLEKMSVYFRKLACMSFEDLLEYAIVHATKRRNSVVTNPLIAFYIDNLVVFDKPIELGMNCPLRVIRKKLVDCGMDCPPYYDEVESGLTKAPQSGCYVYENEI
jgi:hypothetical protein